MCWRVVFKHYSKVINPVCACVYRYMCVALQRAGQRKKCASCHIVIHTGCMARLDQVSTPLSLLLLLLMPLIRLMFYRSPPTCP